MPVTGEGEHDGRFDRALAHTCTSCYWHSYYGYIAYCCPKGSCAYYYCKERTTPAPENLASTKGNVGTAPPSPVSTPTPGKIERMTPAPETPAPTQVIVATSPPTPVSTPPPGSILSDSTSSVPVNSPSDAPNDVPSHAPSRMPVSRPTNARLPCGTEGEALRVCYSSFEDALTCDACVSDRIPGSVDSCSTLESLVCSAIAECRCSPCAADVEGYLNCALRVAVGCPIRCR